MQCYSLCFHVFLLKVALSKVLDPDIEMKGKSGAVLDKNGKNVHIAHFIATEHLSREQ